jgi:hypothetical protein
MSAALLILVAMLLRGDKVVEAGSRVNFREGDSFAPPYVVMVVLGTTIHEFVYDDGELRIETRG